MTQLNPFFDAGYGEPFVSTGRSSDGWSSPLEFFLDHPDLLQPKDLQRIREWYVCRGFVKPVEDILKTPQPWYVPEMNDTEEGDGPPLTNEEFEEYMAAIEESRRQDIALSEKRREQLEMIWEKIKDHDSSDSR